MAQWDRELDDLGRKIQDIVDQAVKSQDYQKLNQTIRQAVDLGEDAVRRAVDGVNRAANQKQSVSKANLPVLYGRTGNRTAMGLLKIAGGGALSAVTLVAAVAGMVADLLLTGTATLGFPALIAMGFLGAGGYLLYSGIRTLTGVSRFKTYRKILGDKTYCTLEKLARAVNKDVRFVRRELRDMIREGLFLEGHLDHEEKNLITSNETYQYYEHSRLQLEAAKKQEAEQARKNTENPVISQVREVLDKGEAFLAEIRRCNDAIPGKEISDKISRMELIVQRIFDRARTNPEIVPDLKKMMDYYLPMTVKLLKAYADMDAQPIQGETIQASKREIEDTLDTLNQAFERLLDSVFQETALDVSSDISVLKTLLAQEGLTGSDFGTGR